MLHQLTLAVCTFPRLSSVRIRTHFDVRQRNLPLRHSSYLHSEDDAHRRNNRRIEERNSTKLLYQTISIFLPCENYS